MPRSVRTAAVLTAVALVLGGAALAPTDSQAMPVLAADSTTMPWLDKTKSPEERADLLVKAMNEDQLVHMLHGDGKLTGGTTKEGVRYIGYVPPIPELRVPAFVMSDGPAGLRNGEPSTSMPAPIAQAASFDPTLAEAYGHAIGQDAKDRGQDLLFSPGFNIARNPTAGRTFEYFGEDPYLSGTIATAHTKGLQGAGVMATLKHYVANNQETNRTQNSSTMDQRTLHEIYEKPFQIAVAGSEPAAVMCAYNKVNGVPACGNSDTLERDLRGHIGFKGTVVTDYPAAWDPKDVKNGLNVELPWKFFTSKLLISQTIAKGEMTWDDVRVRVKETLTQMFRFGLFDQPWDDAAGDRVRTLTPIPPQRGNAVALRTAVEGSVLLKNAGELPLPKTGLKRVLVVGDAAKSTLGGGGSSAGKGLVQDNTLDQISKRLPGVEVVFKSQADPIGIAQEAPKADRVIVVAGVISTELIDRPNLDLLPAEKNAILNAAERNDHVTVVLQTGGPVLMPWLDQVESVLNVWYPGQAGGEATAQLLFGEANPRGRLPQTFPAAEGQKPAVNPEQFPGANMGFDSRYTEGVFVGYRWYTQQKQKPLFPFGYGLSYTTFAYSGARVVSAPTAPGQPVTVEVTVKNTGSVVGAVTPQAYVAKPGTEAVPTPPRELGAFTSATLAPGESRAVRLTIDPLQMSVWDTRSAKFVQPAGTYTVLVGDHVDAVQPAGTFTLG